MIHHGAFLLRPISTRHRHAFVSARAALSCDSGHPHPNPPPSKRKPSVCRGRESRGRPASSSATRSYFSLPCGPTGPRADGGGLGRGWPIFQRKNQVVDVRARSSAALGMTPKPDQRFSRRSVSDNLLSVSVDRFYWSQSANGSRTRIVSSRSGLVESMATGASISSSIRRMYLIAVAGRSIQLRAPRVDSGQPSIVS